VSEEIRILVELSRADLECSRLSGRTESIPRELDKHEAELMVHGRALEVLELHAEDLRRDRRGFEREVESTKTRRRELELQQSRIKNNAEFQAMSHEVEDLRRRVAEIEDQALASMQEEEQVQTEIRRLQDLCAQEERRLGGVRERLNEELASYRQDLEASRQRRDGLVSQLDPQLRSRYERIRRSKGDMAVVGIVQGSCTGCGYHLPAQRVLELQRAERIIACEGCGRLLVWIGE
jgi:predicted  nucleic acid-binding Zn-ribbon protein